MNTDQIIKRLKEGNERYVADKLNHPLQDHARRVELTKGQQPHTIVLSCADSRVVPELAFDTGLGELFVVRVAGNIANTSSMASIEYAVAHCGSKVIVVLGHESCGAVTAAVAGGDNGYNLKTVPVLFGIKLSNYIGVFLMIVGISYLFFLGINNII